jgi:hypothetical protein
MKTKFEMPKNSYIQEVIIVSESRFANREYCEHRPELNGKKAEKNASLKEACWNGQLKDLLPEIFLHFSPDTKLFLWQMRECKNVVTMEMAERPVELDFTTSIDPYCFMELQEYN